MINIYNKSNMELTEKDKKILNTFSLYLQSFGSKVGRYNIDVSTDGDVYWDYTRWTGDGTRMSIDSYPAIDDLLRRIFDENEDMFLYDNFSSDDRGTITFILNTNKKTLTVSAGVYEMETEYTTEQYDWDEIDNEEVKTWFLEMSKKTHKGVVHYEGSGDSGYIEEDIVLDNDERESIPASVDDFLYRKLEHFGGWEINEGSQGDFTFHFDKKFIVLEHGSNYEEEKLVKIPFQIKF